ncbi:MAG: hypothetical protein KA198_00910, partial [Chitinophagaceae bacterium]|nr:hypothetical protein [Chitinophagaceae bacterium]
MSKFITKTNSLMKNQYNKFVSFVIFWGCLLLSTQSFAQAPQLFNYQGIARDIQGNPLGKKTLHLKIAILPTSESVSPEYVETHLVTTNEFGLYTLQIGGGKTISGSMKTVKWETGNKYIQVAIDPLGGNNFVDAGTTQLLSVPYAIYADNAGSAKNNENQTRATNNFIEKTNGSGVANSTSLLFDNGTNIGLGTTSPIAKFHINQNVATVQEHLRMQNLSATGAGRFTLYSNNTNNYATFTKYGSGFAGGYTGISTLYPFGNLLAFGNNGVVADDGLGRFLISTAGNIGISLFKGATSKLKFHADFVTENVGIGGNAVPASRVHFNNTDGTDIDLRMTNNNSGHSDTDGLIILANGNNGASIMNLENGNLALGTDNNTILDLLPNGTTSLSGQIQIAGGNPGAGKILTSDASGLATWETPNQGSVSSVNGSTGSVTQSFT